MLNNKDGGLISVVHHRVESSTTATRNIRGSLCFWCSLAVPARNNVGEDQFTFSFCRNTRGVIRRVGSIESKVSPTPPDRSRAVTALKWQKSCFVPANDSIDTCPITASAVEQTSKHCALNEVAVGSKCIHSILKRPMLCTRHATPHNVSKPTAFSGQQIYPQG